MRQRALTQKMSIIDYTTFNVKSFINEVHKRPVLWDVSNEDYKNRVARQDGWMEICEVFAQDFREKDKEDQLMIGELGIVTNSDYICI